LVKPQAECLIELIERKQKGVAYKTVKIPTQLIIRESTENVF